MSTVILWVYLAGIVPVWCIGAFGIAATSTDRLAASIERQRAIFHSQSLAVEWGNENAAFKTVGLCFVALIAGGAWPVAIPIWFAWRKGNFIDRAVAKRDALAKGAA